MNAHVQKTSYHASEAEEDQPPETEGNLRPQLAVEDGWNNA